MQGLQTGRTEGLTGPTGNERGLDVQNPYFTSNVALAQAKARKAGAEQQVMQGATQQLAPGPTVSPERVQAEQLADGLVQGAINQQHLEKMINDGELDVSVAEAAMGMAQEFMRREQPQGLGF